MSLPSITVYTKPACPQCSATERRLTDKGLPFTLVDVSRDAAALAKVKELGYLAAPVVVFGDEHWSGFRPDKIDQRAAELTVV